MITGASETRTSWEMERDYHQDLQNRIKQLEENQAKIVKALLSFRENPSRHAFDGIYYTLVTDTSDK